MRKLPRKINHRDPVSRIPAAINEVIDYLDSGRLVSGRGIRISEAVNGVTVTATSQKSTGGTTTTETTANYYLCKITGGNNTTGYTVNIYDNFDPNNFLGTGILFFIQNAGLQTESFVDQYVIASRVSLNVIG